MTGIALLSRYRWRELSLLLLPFLILLVAMTQLFVVNHFDANTTFSSKNLPTLENLTPAIGLMAILLIANIVLSIFFRQADQILFPLVGLLSSIGVIMSTRIGPDIDIPTLGTRQLLWVFIGVVFCIVVLFVLRNINWLERYKYTWAVASLLILLPSVISGIRTLRSNAPTRDVLNLGPFNLQPSELLKITIVIFFAAYVSENRDIFSMGYVRLKFLRLPPLRQLGPLLLMLGLSLIIFLIVRELGLALLIYGLFLCEMYLGTGKLSYVLSSLALFGLLAYIGYSLLGYVRARFAVVNFDVVHWQKWTPQQQEFAQGPGLQVLQGLIALGTGKILGTGLGQGHPTQVPVVASDMILTALGEELGLLGLTAILALYLLIIYRGFRIAIEANDTFNQLLAAGLTTIFAIQTLIICAGNLKLMPLTGIPLPFLSYGGSSLIANYLIIGILLRISYNTGYEKEEFMGD